MAESESEGVLVLEVRLVLGAGWLPRRCQLKVVFENKSRWAGALQTLGSLLLRASWCWWC